MVQTVQKFKSFCLQVEERIAHLEFTQAEKANAMTREFWQELPEVLSLLENNLDMRVLIISGAGKHFSAGMDLSVFADTSVLSNNTARERERLRRLILNLQDLYSRFEKLRVPVIAAVHGACLGAALDLICASDMRFASKDAYFCLQEINLAMMADLGVLQRLPRLIPFGVVSELAYTGNKLTAERALQLGLLNAVYEDGTELLSAVKVLAKTIAEKSPLAVSASKEALLFARENDAGTALTQAALLQSAVMDVSEIRSAAAAVAKKQEVVFDALLEPSSI